MQQIAKTIADDGAVTDEQADFINNVIPIETLKEVYRPDTPNTIKFSPEFDDEFLESHKGEFILVWLEMAPNNLRSYCCAWLEETVGYWYVGLDGWLVTEPGYAVASDSQIGANPLLPDAVAHSALFSDDAPTRIMAKVLPFLCRGACLAWLVLLAVFVALGRRWGGVAAALAPLVVFWASFLVAAPISNEFRYLFALHFAVPFIVFCMFSPCTGARTRMVELNG